MDEDEEFAKRLDGGGSSGVGREGGENSSMKPRGLFVVQRNGAVADDLERLDPLRIPHLPHNTTAEQKKTRRHEETETQTEDDDGGNRKSKTNKREGQKKITGGS